MQILLMLLSGFVGALIATLLNVFYDYTTEHVRRRSDVMLQVVAWFDDMYDRLQALHTDKDAAYTNKKRGLTDEEYRIIGREVKTLLSSTKIQAIVALTYGEGEELGMVKAADKELEFIACLLWGADIGDWNKSNKQIFDHFKNSVDPVRTLILRRFLLKTSFKSVTSDLLRQNLPTFHKLYAGFGKKRS